MIDKKHGQGISLLSSRAAGTPGSNLMRTLPGIRLVEPRRQNLLFEQLEVPGLAEEMSFVGRDCIEHDHALFVVLSDARVILRECVQSQCAKALGEPSRQEFCLYLR
jgi:hypothetical protein